MRWLQQERASKMAVRNLVLGACAMAAGLIIGHAVAL
jgi:VIT1/CCC1 family predicted Fe2+/Mn2+ transporter